MVFVRGLGADHAIKTRGTEAWPQKKATGNTLLIGRNVEVRGNMGQGAKNVLNVLFILMFHTFTLFFFFFLSYYSMILSCFCCFYFL